MAGLWHKLRRQMARGRRETSYGSTHTERNHARPAQKETTEDGRLQVQERGSEVVSKEDFLLSQIDEFRERAKQLQSLLVSRETEAEELKTLVDERQEAADELDAILQERQKAADGITAKVERQIDSLIERVASKMDEIEASMKEDVADGKRLNEEKAQEIKTSLAEIETQLTEAKTELSDKVHSENVKCYRNISELLRSMEQRLDRLNALENTCGASKVFALTAMIMGFLNFAGLVVVALIGLGIIAW